jgi:co-chaperonin GroES (HSP10)
LPDDVKNRQQERFGEILRVGPDVPKELKPGLKIAMNFFTGTNVDATAAGLPDGEYKLLKAEDVLATVAE